MDLAFICEHTNGLSREELEDNEVLVDSCLFRLIQVAENSDKLTAEFKAGYSAIPWRAMKGMRNRIVHGYFTKLKTALAEQGFFEDTEPHKLVICGDLYDRGTEALRLQEFILDLLSKDQAFLQNQHTTDCTV